MDGEAGVSPGEQQLDALGSDQGLALEKGEHLVPEQPLCDARIHVGDREEALVARPAAAGHESMDMRMRIDAIAEALDDLRCYQ